MATKKLRSTGSEVLVILRWNFPKLNTQRKHRQRIASPTKRSCDAVCDAYSSCWTPVGKLVSYQIEFDPVFKPRFKASEYHGIASLHINRLWQYTLATSGKAPV